jgi:hypothetical protein
MTSLLWRQVLRDKDSPVVRETEIMVMAVEEEVEHQRQEVVLVAIPGVLEETD